VVVRLHEEFYFSSCNVENILHCDGNWTPNLRYLTELPKGKCVIEFDEATDIFEAKKILGDRVCICGGLMEILLSFETPKRIEENCRKLIDIVGESRGVHVSAMIKTAKKLWRTFFGKMGDKLESASVFSWLS